MITTDSGLAHLAVQCGKPILMITHHGTPGPGSGWQIYWHRYNRENHTNSKIITVDAWNDCNLVLKKVCSQKLINPNNDVYHVSIIMTDVHPYTGSLEKIKELIERFPNIRIILFIAAIHNKKRIIDLRSQGYSYKKIHQKLGFSIDTIMKVWRKKKRNNQEREDSQIKNIRNEYSENGEYSIKNGINDKLRPGRKA